jgi:uncharacterized protein with FMN-binding domain
MGVIECKNNTRNIMNRHYKEGKIHPALATILVIVLVGIVASVAITVQTNNDRTMNQSQATNNTSTPTTTDTSAYKDGTYSATGSYLTPGGRESIELTVTIANGVITTTQLKENASDRDAEEYQAAFAGSYQELVVGKKVGEVSLSRVAGSSLTSNGFNEALRQIKQDAKA